MDHYLVPMACCCAAHDGDDDDASLLPHHVEGKKEQAHTFAPRLSSPISPWHALANEKYKCLAYFASQYSRLEYAKKTISSTELQVIRIRKNPLEWRTYDKELS